MHGKRENFKADKNVTAIVPLEEQMTLFILVEDNTDIEGTCVVKSVRH